MSNPQTGTEAALRELHPFDQLSAIEGLLQRVVAPGHGGVGAAAFSGLGFRVGDWALAVSMDSLNEILRPEGITRVPGAKPWFRGVMNLRGTVLSVTDLGAFVGRAGIAHGIRARVLVFQAAGWCVGLAVDEVSGLRSFRKDERCSDPAATRTLLDDYRIDAFETDGEVWRVLDPTRLLSDSRFRAAAA